MRTSTDQLARMIRGGSFRVDVTADVFYGASRLLQDVPVTEWSFFGDLSAEIPTGGSLTIAYQGAFADSATPREVDDALAPFGQIVIPYLTVSAGPFSERIQVGVFRIDEVPSAHDEFTTTRGGRRLVTGSIVELELADLFQAVKRAKFRSLEQPATTSAWAEIARITGLPVTQTVTDGTIPLATTYDRSRLAAVRGPLATVLDGRAVMLSDGTVGVVPNTAGAPSFDYGIGEDGVLIDVGYGISSEDKPNVIVGDFESTAGAPIHVEADSTTVAGIPATDSPYGEYVEEFPDDLKQLYTSRPACQAAVNAYLQRIWTGTPPQIPVTTLFDPRIELGDVGYLRRVDRTLTVRVVKYSMSGSAEGDRDMKLTAEVLADVPV